MARLSLFEVAVLLHPEDEDEEDTEVLHAPETILAASQDSAARKAIREVDEGHGNEDRWDVLVRPFG